MTNKIHENGSVLILVMLGVLLLSVVGVMGLNKTKTEVNITRNYYADKTAFFTAESGLSIGKNLLRNTLDPGSVVFGPVDTVNTTYRSGALYDSDGLVITSPQNVIPFTTFPAPPPTGMTLDQNMGLHLTTWELSVTSQSTSTVSQQRSRKELTTIIAILQSEY